MATKRDLVEGQEFARRRLLTAFTSGAPAGRELEPTKPLRGVAAGLLLTALLVVGSLAWGLLAPTLPTGWDTGSLVIVKGVGTRYVGVDGTLYPVLNATSARLVVPSASFHVVQVAAGAIEDAPRGVTIGIVGAPDAPPAADRLVATGWSACVAADGGTRLWVGASAAGAVPAVVDGLGALVEAGDDLWLVADGVAHRIPAQDRTAVLRALGLEQVTPVPASGAWLTLMGTGADLEPLVIDGAGDPVPATSALPADVRVGTVVEVAGAGDAVSRYVVDRRGQLLPMSDLAAALYAPGSGAQSGAVWRATAAEVSAVATAAGQAGAADWPVQVPDLPADGRLPCVTLTTGDEATLSMGAVDAAAAAHAGVSVQSGGGALVRAQSAPGAVSVVWLVDEAGTAFPVPDASDEVLARLGFAAADVTVVPPAWTALFPTGPTLTTAAAGTPVGAAGTTTPVGAVATDGATQDETHGPTGGATATATATATAAAAAGMSGPAGAGVVSVDGALLAEGTACSVETPALVATAPAALSTLAAQRAWRTSTGAGVLVADVDSGVAADNVHLADAVVPGLDLVGVDVEVSGRTDVDGHGTAIAGIVAARPVDGSGLVGIAPEATVLPVRVFYGRTDDAVAAGVGPDTGRLAAGIVAAADAGAQVINVSLSVSSPDPALEAAVAHATAAGALVVASAGNRTSADTPDGPRWPAAYDGVLAVAAVGADGSGTTDAVHGPHVLVAAPGTDVLTTFFGAGDCVQGATSSASWATAYVSGAAALIAARYPQETPAQWAYRLEVTAARLAPAARDDVVGWGVVRPDLALAFVDDGAAPGPASPSHARPASAGVTVAQVAGGTVVRPLAAVQRHATWWALVSVAAVLSGALALRLVGAGGRAGRGRGPA